MCYYFDEMLLPESFSSGICMFSYLTKKLCSCSRYAHLAPAILVLSVSSGEPQRGNAFLTPEDDSISNQVQGIHIL